MVLFLGGMIFPIVVFLMFYALSKFVFTDYFLSSSFECGFSPYFFSRSSFSIHYFLVGLIFLFLDMEICVMFFFFFCMNSSFYSWFYLFFFCLILLLGLLLEVKNCKVEWFD